MPDRDVAVSDIRKRMRNPVVDARIENDFIGGVRNGVKGRLQSGDVGLAARTIRTAIARNR